MRMLRTIMAGALAVTLATACSDSTDPGDVDPGDVTGNDLVGTWEATAATFTPDGSTTSFDLIADGFGITLVIRADGTYTATFTELGFDPEVEDGTYTVSAGVITITPTVGDDVESFTIVSLNATTLVLSDPDAVEDDEGVDVPGTLRLVLQKQ